LDEITELEIEDYKWSHFSSDIGGGAGLILGIRCSYCILTYKYEFSMASILGVVDLAIVLLIKTLKRTCQCGKQALSPDMEVYKSFIKVVDRRSSYDAAIAISSLTRAEFKQLRYRN